MSTKFKLSLLSVMLLTTSLNCFSAEEINADEVNEESKAKNTEYELNSDEKKLLDKTTYSFKANELKDLYAQTSLNNNISFDKRYMLNEPLSLREVLNFNHPYLNTLLSDLNEGDRDAILEATRLKAAKDQRHKSILLTAMKFATDSAFYMKSRSYHKKLMGPLHSVMTDIFPFPALTLENGEIRPPVIEEISYTVEIEDKRTKRKINKRYRIDQQAQVMNAPQTYMDFFMNLTTNKPKTPNVYMLPITEEELEFWRKGVLNGWSEGNRLANELIRANIREAMRNFVGQLRFHYLASANIISMPTSQNVNVGTNSNGYAVNIGESIFEITDLPRFNDDEIKWLALPQVDDIFNELTKDDVDYLSDNLYQSGDLK